MTYAEYLKSLGATDEEIKEMDKGVARKAFEKQQADLEAAAANYATIQGQYADYQTRVTDWYNENNAALLKTKEFAVQQRAEAERAKAALIEAQKQGLLNVAKDLGYEAEPPKQNPAAPDDRYITTDRLAQIADSVGDNLAQMQDFVGEFTQLFPGQRLNVSALRKEALAAGKNFYEYAEQKYKIPAAREAAAQKQRDAEIAKWKMEGAKEKETELISKFGNPETRPMMPSKSPFTVRKDDALRADNQPWNKSEAQLQKDRVERATQKFLERQNSGLN